MNKEIINITRWEEGNDWVRVLYRAGKRLQLTELLDTQYLINYIANSPYKFLFSYYSIVEGLRVVVLNNTHIYISKGTIYMNLDNISEVIDIQNKTIPLPLEEGLYWLRVKVNHNNFDLVNDNNRNPIHGGPKFGSYGMVKDFIVGSVNLVQDQSSYSIENEGFPIALINIKNNEGVDILYINSGSDLSINQSYNLSTINPYVERYFFEESGDFISKGLNILSPNNKSISVLPGICYIDGKRIVIENPINLLIKDYFEEEGEYAILINSLGYIEIKRFNTSVYPLLDYLTIETSTGSKVTVNSFYYSDTNPEQNQVYIWKDEDRGYDLPNISISLGLSETGINHLLLGTIKINKDISKEPVIYYIDIYSEDSYRAISSSELIQVISKLESLEKRLLDLELDKQLISKVETNLIDKKASSLLIQYSDIHHPFYTASYIEEDNVITLKRIETYIKVISSNIHYSKGLQRVSSLNNKELLSSPELSFEKLDISKGNSTIVLESTPSNIFILLGKPNRFANDIHLYSFNVDNDYLIALSEEYITNFDIIYGSNSSEQYSSILPKNNVSIVKFNLPGNDYRESPYLSIESDNSIIKSIELSIDNEEPFLIVDSDYYNLISQTIKIDTLALLSSISIHIDELNILNNEALPFILVTITKSNRSIPLLNEPLSFGYISISNNISDSYVDINVYPALVLEPNDYSINIMHFNSDSISFKCNSNNDTNGQEYTLGNLLIRDDNGIWESLLDKDLNISLNLGEPLYSTNSVRLSVQSNESFIGIKDNLDWIGNKGDFNNMMILNNEYQNIQDQFTPTSSITLNYELANPLAAINLDTSYFTLITYLQSGNWISKTLDIGSSYQNIDLWLDYYEPEGSSIDLFISSNKGQEWERLLRDEVDSSKFYIHNLTESVPYKELTEENITILREWVTIKITLNTENILNRPYVKDIKFISY